MVDVDFVEEHEVEHNRGAVLFAILEDVEDGVEVVNVEALEAFRASIVVEDFGEVCS